MSSKISVKCSRPLTLGRRAAYTDHKARITQSRRYLLARLPVRHSNIWSLPSTAQPRFHLGGLVPLPRL